MKISKFNVIEKIGKDTFIYNTYSGSVLRLNEKYGDIFHQYLHNGKLNDEALKTNLLKGGMVIEDSIDEISNILCENNIKRFSGSIASYTIAPTMKCNFRCPYCYEKNIAYSTMDFAVISKMKKILEQSKQNNNYLAIAWYGGEPLLAFDIIEELTFKAIELYSAEHYQASMVTNGYLLTKDIAQRLEELKIVDIQITIDGPPDIHNIRRKLPNMQDTFFVILNNIKTALQVYRELNITIRINVDRENIDRIDEVISYLEEYKIREKVSVYLAPVDNINNTCNSSLCFNNKEFALEQIKFINRNLENNCNFVHLPKKRLYMCGAVSSNSFVIDALGDIYKCWDDVGRQENKAGSILEDNLLNNYNFTKWISYSISDDKECLNCTYLPVCMGGCPNSKIKKESRSCVPIKENSREMIELLYKLKIQSN